MKKNDPIGYDADKVTRDYESGMISTDEYYLAEFTEIDIQMTLIPCVVAMEDCQTIWQLYDVLNKDHPELAEYVVNGWWKDYFEHTIKDYAENPVHYIAYQYVQTDDKYVKQRLYNLFLHYTTDANLEDLLLTGPLFITEEDFVSYTSFYENTGVIPLNDFLADPKKQIEFIGKAARASEFAREL